jgi:hypothetical protein
MAVLGDLGRGGDNNGDVFTICQCVIHIHREEWTGAWKEHVDSPPYFVPSVCEETLGERSSLRCVSDKLDVLFKKRVMGAMDARLFAVKNVFVLKKRW